MEKKYTVSKDNGWTKVRDAIKAALMSETLETAQETYDEAAIVRLKSGDSGTNEIAVKVSEVEEDGKVYPVYARFAITISAWKDRTNSKGKVQPAFNFAANVERYEKYVGDKAQKAADSAKKKAERIEKDTARREKEKAEKENAK